MISTPFSHYLDLLKHDLPDELISDVSFSKIRKVASQVPGALAFSAFGFECRMGDREPAADFLFSLQKNNSGPEIFSGKLPELRGKNATRKYVTIRFPLAVIP